VAVPVGNKDTYVTRKPQKRQIRGVLEKNVENGLHELSQENGQ
jgi:hypothetical protein